MADYCDIQRTHNPQDTLNIEVLRFATDEILEGQLNGRELAVLTTTFGDRYGREATYANYVEVSDDTGAIIMDIPEEWQDIDGAPWVDEQSGAVGAAIAAARDVEAWATSFTEPGVFFFASRELAQIYDEASFLDSRFDLSQYCTYNGRFEYADPLYTGLYDEYVNCDNASVSLICVAAVPEDREFLIWVSIQIVSDADFEALDHILNTFVVVGDLP